MQRSRKALLNRRAGAKTSITGRHHLDKVSLSLVFVLWGLLFLLSLWISHGDGHEDSVKPDGISIPTSTWEESKLECGTHSDPFIVHTTRKADSIHSCAASHIIDATSNTLSEVKDCQGCKDKVLVEESSKDKSATVQKPEVEKSEKSTKLETEIQKMDRLPLGLDEFKSRTYNGKSKSGNDRPLGIKHRMEPGGKEYNYASASKGAKVLAFNKEAKGASNVLGRDKDKYLRNPCSAEEKYVIIELSEETLVDAIEIANFEHYSSNLRVFELLGSLIYPTDDWVSLGNITAANVKVAQTFLLSEPKWVRYLKLNLLSHYGSEFYCTLSTIEVYGVDAVERMLEDLISVEKSVTVPVGEPKLVDEKTDSSEPEPLEASELDQDIAKETVLKSETGISNLNAEMAKSDVPDPVEEIRHQQVGRVPGDTALKILVQKVRSLDINLSVLERYLEEITSRYGNIFKEINKDIGDKDTLVEKIRMEIYDLLENQRVMANNVDDLVSWKSLASLQMDSLLRDNAILRHEVEKVREKQTSIENKNVNIFLLCLIFATLAIVRLFVDTAGCLYSRSSEKSGKFCPTSSSWFFLVLLCVLTLFTLSL